MAITEKTELIEFDGGLYKEKEGNPFYFFVGASQNAKEVIIHEDTKVVNKHVSIDHVISLVIKAKEVSIEEYAFAESHRLESLQFVGNKKVILEKGSFYRCKKLAKLKFSTGEFVFYENCFKDCPSLSSGFKLPENCTCLGKGCFNKCNLPSIFIPICIQSIKSCFEVDTEIFYEGDASSLAVGERSEYAGEEEWDGDPHHPSGAIYVKKDVFASGERFHSFATYEGWKEEFVNSIKRTKRRCCIHCNAIITKDDETCPICEKWQKGDFDIENGVLYSYHGEEKVVVIPEAVTSVFHNAFGSRCPNKERIERVVFPKGLEKIGDRSFEGCKNLEELTLPEGLEFIGHHAFNGCQKLKSVFIPSSTNCICELPFGNCDSLERIDVDENNQWYSSFNGVLLDKTQKTVIDAPIGLSGKVTLPEAVKIIDEFAFSRCKNITEIILPPNLKRIEEYAFHGCESLSQITFPSSLKWIGPGAFSATGLRHVDWPSQIETIGEAMFDRCEKLESIIIPEGVKQFDSEAFHGCISLKELKLPSSLETVYHAITFCDSLKELFFPDSVNILYGVSCNHSLEAIRIGGARKVIGENIVMNNESLKKVTLGEGIEEIHDWWLQGCKIEELHLPSTLKIITSRAFLGVLSPNCQIYWPISMADLKQGKKNLFGSDSVTIHFLDGTL